ncbi:hypothetical protein [Dyella sp. ASV21]|uniref:hypothetical protein n=1 Tax=Dyella sp. ASV21 TaxID=2795114 RepID=UPI0018EB09B3|nr:hypothetical protein [Dyella sp. ASV21]
MNRILQAEVILTLTRDQASDLEMALLYANHSPVASRDEKADFAALGEVIGQQCAKQGVKR